MQNSTPIPQNTTSQQPVSQPNGAHDAAEELKSALMNTAKQLELKAMLEGLAEGYHAGELSVARKLLKMQLPRDTILQATGLTEEELDRISDH